MLVTYAVALVPVGFPLSKDVETRLDHEINFVVSAERVRSGNVSNKVVVIQVVDVSGELGVQ